MSAFLKERLIAEEDLNSMARNISQLFVQFKESHEDSNTNALKEFLNILFETALTKGIPPTHRVAACNVYCAVIEECIMSQSDEKRSMIRSSEYSNMLLDIYTDRDGYAKAKATKQVLNTLTKLYLACNQYNNSGLMDQGVKRLLHILSTDYDHIKAKAAIQAINHFLLKGLFSGASLIENWGRKMKGEISCADTAAFLREILKWISHPDLGPAVGQLMYLVLLDMNKIRKHNPTYDSQNTSDILPIWTLPLLENLVEFPENLQSLKTYVFPGLFKLNISDFWQFLLHLRVNDHLLKTNSDDLSVGGVKMNFEHGTLLLFSALQVGKDHGLIKESSDSIVAAIDNTQDIILVSDVVIGKLLQHESPTVRISSFGLLVSSYHSTRPMTPASLKYLRKNLPRMHADVDAHFRSEVHGLIVTLIGRLKAIIGFLTKQLQREEDKRVAAIQHGQIDGTYGTWVQEQTQILNLHQDFVYWYLRLASFELHPLASYQRHATALHTLNKFLRSGIDLEISDHLSLKLSKDESRWPFSIELMTPTLRRALFDLLVNPFEDIRQAVLSLLRLHESPVSSVDRETQVIWHQLCRGRGGGLQPVRNSTDQDINDCQSFIKRAKSMMIASGRADQADGMARAYLLLIHLMLIKKSRLPVNSSDIRSVKTTDKSGGSIIIDLLTLIEAAIGFAKSNMAIAVSHHPLHGYYSALRYIISDIPNWKQEWKKELHSLDKICARIYLAISQTWECVRYVLCNDAPEGFLPEEMQNTYTITTKDVLSYAWLAVKESTLLIRAIIPLELFQDSPVLGNPLKSFLEAFGELCFWQLADLRHRGAFSAVAQTFSAVCQQCVVTSTQSKDMLRVWYEHSIALIEERGTNTTRRSAGIPAILVAVLSANIQSPLFEESIYKLQQIVISGTTDPARDAENLPQVHALNCLKAIFTNTKFGNRVETHIVDIMNVAALSLRSSTWSVRNCGLMLFRSLVDRLLGTNESFDDSYTPRFANSYRFIYTRFPGLIDLIKGLLQGPKIKDMVELSVASNPEISISISEAVFAALDFLRRATPPKTYLEEFRRLVIRASRSPQWQVRDMAARTYNSLVPAEESFAEVRSLMASETLSYNDSHGRLLIVKRMIASASCVLPPENFLEILPIIDDDLVAIFHNTKCTTIRSACLDILNSFGEQALDDRHRLVSSKLAEDFVRTSAFMQVSEASNQHSDVADAPIYRSMTLNGWIYHLLLEIPMDLPLQFYLNYVQEDVALYLLQRLSEILPNSTLQKIRATAKVLCQNLCLCSNYQITSAGEHLLGELLDRITKNGDWNNAKFVHDYFHNTDCVSRLQQVLAPSALESLLRIWGYAIASRFCESSKIWTKSLINETEIWLRTLKMSSVAPNDFSTRYAAALSLQRFTSAMPQAETFPVSLRTTFLILILETLHDDDEQIRECSARTVEKAFHSSRAFSRSASPAAPPAASNFLRVYLGYKCVHNDNLAYEAVARAIGQRFDTNDVKITSLESSFEGATREDNALFVVEKQNLYVDEMQEAYEWSQILKRTSIHLFSKEIVKALIEWAVNGLELLKEKATESKDGTLGWTSNPEVFMLGMRVFFTADVLLEWSARSTEIQIPATLIRSKLFKLLAVGETTHLHGMWQRKIDSILKRSIWQVMHKALDKAVHRFPSHFAMDSILRQQPQNE